MDKNKQNFRLTKEGRLYGKYDPKAIPILKRLPGATWNSRGNCWQVSVAENDLPRVFEVCRQLDIEVDPALLN